MTPVLIEQSLFNLSTQMDSIMALTDFLMEKARNMDMTGGHMTANCLGSAMQAGMSLLSQKHSVTQNQRSFDQY